MRLPWPFGQRTPSDGSSKGEPAEGPDGPSASRSPASTQAGELVPGALAADAPPTGAWRSLPPIQRTAGPAPLVASPSAFLADVPGHQGLPSIVPHLGHESSPAAPAGLVVARVSATPGLTSSAPMPMKPLQRRTSVEPGSSETRLGTDQGANEPAGAPASSSMAVPEPAPVRTLAAVTPSATVSPPARPLTVAPAPAPVVQRSTAGSPARTATSAVTPVPGPHPVSGTGAHATHATPALPLAARAGDPVQRSRWSEAPAPGPTATPGGMPGGAPRGTPGAVASGAVASGPSITPKAGLGAPISVSHDAASTSPAPAGPDAAQRGAESTGTTWSAANPALHAASGGARRAGLGAPVTGPLPVAQRSTPMHSSPTSTPAPALAPAPTAPAPTPRPLPVLPVARRAAAPGLGEHARADHTSAGPARPAGPGGPGGLTAGATSSSTTGPIFVPIAGARPLRPSIPAQRTADGSSATAAPEVVAATWGQAAALPDTVASLPLQRHDEDAVPLQRLADSATDAGGTSTAVPMREISFPTAPGTPSGASPGNPSSFAGLDAFAGPGLPGPALAGSANTAGEQRGRPASTSAAWAPGPVPPAGQAPVQRRVPSGSRTADSAPLTLARSHAVGQSGASAATTASSHARTGTWITSDAPAPTVQATATSPSASTSAGTAGQLPTFTATPVVQRVEGSAPEPPSAEGHTETELDELAKAIFGRIRNHLRTEVIHEREAKGLTFDAF